MRIAADSLIRSQTHGFQRLFHHVPFLRLGRGELEIVDGHGQHVLDLVEGVVDLEGVLEDHLYIAQSKTLVIRTWTACACPYPCRARRLGSGRWPPEGARANVVLPLPLSPTTAVIVGGWLSIAMDEVLERNGLCLVEEAAAKHFGDASRFQQCSHSGFPQDAKWQAAQVSG